MARYNKAEIRIDEVVLDSQNFNIGDEVGVEVTVTNTKTTTSSTSGSDAFFVAVASPQVDQHIIAYCGIIGPGESRTIDDSGTMDPGTNGDLPVTQESMDVTVVAGGHQADLDCTYNNISTETPRDTAQITVEATPTLAAIDAVDLSIDSSSGGERTATLNYTVNSTSDNPVVVEVEITPGNSIDSIPISANGAQSRTVEFDFDNQTQTEQQLCANIISAEYA